MCAGLFRKLSVFENFFKIVNEVIKDETPYRRDFCVTGLPERNVIWIDAVLRGFVKVMGRKPVPGRVAQIDTGIVEMAEFRFVRNNKNFRAVMPACFEKTLEPGHDDSSANMFAVNLAL